MSRNPILWKPTQEQIEKTQLESFRKQVNMRFDIDIKDYADLHKWSINNIEDFWNRSNNPQSLHPQHSDPFFAQAF